MHTFVAMSGGIDSTALALALPDAACLFTDTGDEFDEVLAHIERFEAVTGREVIRIQGRVEGGAFIPDTLPAYIERHKFFPNHRARYCTRMFKIEPMNWYLQQHTPARLCIGLRADEPEDLRVGNLTEMPGLEIAYPMREWGWTRREAVLTCMEYDLLPRYAPYMARGGCKGCFYKRRSEVVAIVHLRPDIAEELHQRELAVQDERGEPFHMFSNVGQPVADLRRAVEQQTLMFSLEDIYAAASDSEDKGVACGLFCHR